MDVDIDTTWGELIDNLLSDSNFILTSANLWSYFGFLSAESLPLTGTATEV